MPAPRKYPPELRERAMRLVHEAREEDPELSITKRCSGSACGLSGGQAPVPVLTPLLLDAPVDPARCRRKV